MPMMPLGPYMPDLPPIGHPGLLRCVNVIPIAGGYAPMPRLANFSGQLSAYCRGGLTGRDKNGASFTVAGDATKLYLRKTGSLADATRASGGPYTTSTTGRWSFAQFSNAVYAANYDDEIQKLSLSSTQFANLGATNAPRCRSLAAIRNFLVAGYCYDPTGGPVGIVPNRVHWSAFGNPDSWPLYGSSAARNVQSDKQDLQGGEVQKVVSHADIGLVLMDRAIWRMDYTGGDTFFTFSPLALGDGTIAPGSVVTKNGMTFFWSESGWKMTDGASVRGIGSEVIDRTFAANLEINNRHLMSGAAHPRKPIIWWTYPSGGSMRLLLYHYELNQWAEGDEVVEFIMESLPAGTSMDDYTPPDNLDTPTPPFDTGTMDDGKYLGFPWDLGGFNAQHSLGIFNGPNRTATLETGDREILQNQRTVINRVRVVGDTNAIIVAVGARGTPYAAVEYESFGIAEEDGTFPCRANGRYHRATLVGSNFTSIQGLDADGQPEGRR